MPGERGCPIGKRRLISWTKVQKLQAEGNSLYQVSRALDVSPQTVSNWIKTVKGKHRLKAQFDKELAIWRISQQDLMDFLRLTRRLLEEEA